MKRMIWTQVVKSFLILAYYCYLHMCKLQLKKKNKTKQKQKRGVQERSYAKTIGEYI